MNYGEIRTLAEHEALQQQSQGPYGMYGSIISNTPSVSVHSSEDEAARRKRSDDDDFQRRQNELLLNISNDTNQMINTFFATGIF